ncbi:hypothetical protein FBULB1_12270 [Fusarium bulbicola]|nr:hypothetical protein FBULB1_12270 [Fusarium bulbicola]
MQVPITFTSLIIVSTFSFTGVSGKCFTSGINWSSKDLAVGHVEAACRGGVFTGVFKPGERKYLCVRAGENLKWEFAITNQNTRDSFDLQNEHCIGGLSNEVRGCDKGGPNMLLSSSDPNVGYCK